MAAMEERSFTEKIKSAGGAAFVVGGWVRDRIRGVPEHDRRDKDYVVTGLAEAAFCSLFPKAFKTGRAFPVYRLEISGARCEVALARSEAKSGLGYRGFTTAFSPATTVEQDLYRRDTTINSIALSLKTGKFIDPYGGIADIEAGIIRATSHHFADDPVRALRAARQSAEMGFSIEAGTLRMMAFCRAELALEPGERLVAELGKALAASKPSLFFRNLRTAGILGTAYPRIDALAGRPQPQAYHPEGDAFEHTMLAVDKSTQLTNRPEVRFAVLAHDLGKALTPNDELPRHREHDRLGTTALVGWNREMTLPGTWMKCARFAIAEHMRAPRIERPGAIAGFIARLEASPLGLDGIRTVILCDNKEIPDFLKRYDEYLRAFRSVSGAHAPAHLHGPEIGQWLRERRASAIAGLLRAQRMR